MTIDQTSIPPSGQDQTLASKPLAEGEPKIEYFKNYTYFFEHPDWMNSLLMGSVCMLIPILNGILLAGYRYEIVEMKLRFPDQLYPKFDFARFSQYLTRGIWPFLIDMIVQMVLTLPLLIVIYGSIIAIGITMANNETAGVIVLAVVLPLVILFVLTISMLLSLVMVPLYLRAGLSQDFAQAFKFDWIKDFLKKVWLPTLLLNLFLMVSGGMLAMLGEMACFIGLFPAIFLLGGPVVGLAHYQLYRLYLARGGEPIPLKPLELPPEHSPAPAGYVAPIKPLA